MVSFSEPVDHAEDDNVSIHFEKPPPQEGLASVLRLVYQLCPSAASAAPVCPQRSCDFGGFLLRSPHLVTRSPLLHCFIEL